MKFIIFSEGFEMIDVGGQGGSKKYNYKYKTAYARTSHGRGLEYW